ncbi:MAG: hypothetical protein AAF739_16860 [Pseudomonadota bacterium]
MSFRSGFRLTLLSPTSIALVIVAAFLTTGAALANQIQNQVASLANHHSAKAFFSDNTLIYHDGAVGTVAMQLSSQGNRADIWYPGGDTLVVGRWAAASFPLTNGRNRNILCLYVRNGISVVPRGHDTGLIQDNISACYFLDDFSRNIVSVVAGDPYGLFRANRAPSLIPDKRRYSAQSLLRMAGG